MKLPNLDQKGSLALPLLGVLILIAALILAGWYFKVITPDKLGFAPAKQTPKAPIEKVVIGIKSAPLGFYGQDSVEYESPTLNFNSNIFEGLTTFDKDLKFASRQLVESWDNPSDTTWRLRLRKGVLFHDGSQFTSEDAKFSIDFAKNYVIKDDLALVKAVRIIDQYTIEIDTDGPSPLLLNNLINAYVLSKAHVEKNGFDQPIGTGPYKFVEQSGNDYTLVANDNYYLGKPTIRNVIYRVIEDNDQRIDALIAGSVDLVEDVPASRIDDIRNNKNLTYKGAPSLRVIYLAMDVASSKLKYSSAATNPFKKPEVRQAFYKGIDEEAIIKEVMGGHAYLATQPATSVNFGYNSTLMRPKYDPEGARELLKRAGFENGFDIVLDVSNNRYHNDEAIGKKIVADLNKIGIKATLNAQPKDIFFEKVLDNSDTSFYMLGWSQDNGDAGGAYGTLIHTPVKDGGYGGFNIGGYSNVEIDKLIEESDKVVDSVKRLKQLQEIAKKTMEDVAVIPLHQQEDSFAMSNSFIWTPRRDNGIRAFEIIGK